MKRTILSAAICAALAMPMLAQGGPPQGGGAQGGQGATKTVKLKADTFIKQVDKNGDGKITKEEWNAAGLTDRGFDVMNSKGAGGVAGAGQKNLGYITKDTLEVFDFKADVDSNNDGKLTLEKLLAFEKSAAGQPPSGGQGGGQGGAPPSGGQGGAPPQQ
jgi:hypothetical protein